MRTYIGIDNGITGGIYILPARHETRHWGFPTPCRGPEARKFIDVLEMRNKLGNLRDRTVVFEAGTKNPDFGAKGNYSQGQSHGRLMAFCELEDIPFIIVSAKQWQSVIFELIQNPKGLVTTKDKSKQFYYEQTQIKIKHDGIADAFCIAWFARLKKL